LTFSNVFREGSEEREYEEDAIEIIPGSSHREIGLSLWPSTLNKTINATCKVLVPCFMS
jgi:hypothetical protein